MFFPHLATWLLLYLHKLLSWYVIMRGEEEKRGVIVCVTCSHSMYVERNLGIKKRV